MTTITTTVRTHRRGLAVVGALAALLLAAVTLLLFNTSQVHDMHHLITSNHVLPQFVRTLLGAGRIGS
jgi:hypothetical protein